MKITLLLLLVITGFTASATTYYFSNSGSDANDGTSASTPWQTIAKFNAVFASKAPGDNFLFNTGDVFYGNMIISRSGTSRSPITIGAYGTNAAPVITGFTTVSAWANLGGNIWESASAVSALSTLNMVSINGVNTAMGRYPNAGTWSIYSSPTSSTITTTLNSGTANWTGAEAVIRKNDYSMDRCTVTRHSGTVLTYTNMGGKNAGTAKYGFFIQNDVRTLDVQNEWYYNPSTKKIRIFSTSSPANVQVATVTNIVSSNGFHFITINGLNFTGANSDALSFASLSNNNTIQNCTISFAGLNAINMTGNNDLINNNIINNAGQAGILKRGNMGAVITNNSITNCGIVTGQAFTANYARGIHTSETRAGLIQYNIIKNVGSVGIGTSSNVTSVEIRNNFVDSTVIVLNDFGGIYTGGKSTGRIIDGNVVTNALGNTEGTPATNLAEGIYLDEMASHVTVTNNTVANCGDAGIKLHKANTNIVNNNTVYNNSKKQITYEDATNGVVHNNVMKNNILFCKASAQYCFSDRSSNNDVRTFFSVCDSNYWARPIDDNLTFNTHQANTGFVNKNLAEWQPFTGKDVHSKKSPKTITDVNDLRLEYNATDSNKTVSLDANYIDVRGKSYPGTITLAPYSSAVLIKNGATTNQSPTANAGADQSLILPTNSASLTGSGTDADGIVTAYGWAKISGPAAGTITSPNSVWTSVTGLVQGIYQFQLKVTDNNAATTADTIQVTINDTGNVIGLLPAVNPANTVNGLDYKYYQAGDYSSVPIFSTLTPVKTGTTPTFDISLANRANSFAFNYTGFVDVPSDGQYTFYTTSDNGSNLYIDNVLVVNNDGVHSSLEKSGIIGLKAGKHAISVGYFQQRGGKVLTVSYSATGILKSAVPTSALYRISTQTNNHEVSADRRVIDQTTISATQVVVKAYPNPFIDHFEINITGGVAGEYKLMLIDASGKLIWTAGGIKNTGSFQQSVNTSNLVSGIYFLRVTQNNTTSVIKLVK